MNQALLSRLTQITKVVLDKQMHCKDEAQVLLFDRQCGLSSLLADAYGANMPQAEKLDFDQENPEELREKLLGLPSGSTVVLVQSTNFRLDDFRIRLQLFNAGIGCLEHAHLNYFTESEYETYADALEFRGDYYKKVGGELAQKLENAGSIMAFFGNRKTEEVLRFVAKCSPKPKIFLA